MAFNMKDNLGYSVFLFAIVLAFVGAILTEVAALDMFILLSLVVGVILGLLNISKKEQTMFLLGYIALSVVSGVLLVANVFTTIPFLGSFLASLLSQFVAIFGGAALVVAVVVLVKALKNK